MARWNWHRATTACRRVRPSRQTDSLSTGAGSAPPWRLCKPFDQMHGLQSPRCTCLRSWWRSRWVASPPRVGRIAKRTLAIRWQSWPAAAEGSTAQPSVAHSCLTTSARATCFQKFDGPTLALRHGCSAVPTDPKHNHAQAHPTRRAGDTQNISHVDDHSQVCW